MKRRRGAWRIVIWVTAAVLGAGFLPPLARSQGAPGGSSPLTMEELEVRGIRTKPGRLFFSAANPAPAPAEPRMDLFRDDLDKPILPWEIPQTPPSGKQPPRQGIQ